MEKNREIRKLMLGRVVNDNGTLRAPRENERYYINGAGNGFSEVLILGLMKREYHYRVENKEEALKQVGLIFECIGRRVCLETHPEAVACIKRNSFSDMVFFAAAIEGKDLVITCFTGKHLMGFALLTRSLNGVDKKLPSSFERVAFVKPRKKKKKNKKNKKATLSRKKLTGAIYDIKDRLGVETDEAEYEALSDDDSTEDEE